VPGNNLGTAHGNIKINTSDLKNADIALRSAGRGMIGMGAAAVGAFGLIVAEAAKFEKEMDFVQAITVASGDQMDALKEKAIQLGKESVFGPVELAQAFTDLAKAGASVEDIIGGVGEASVQLAQAADVEIPFAGENLINILNTFKLGAGDAAHVADLLAGAANASSVELEDIVTTMRYAGPVAQALGISIEDVNDAISVLGRVGIKGSIAGTSLRFAMTHLIPDTKKAQEAITGLGLHIDESTGAVTEFTDTEGNLKDLASIFQILQDKTKDLSSQQKVAVVNDIFGVRAMPSVLELMNAGRAGFEDLHNEIAKTTAADVAAKRLDNLSGSIAKLKATIKAVMTEAGGPFQETVKGWVDWLRELILAFDALPDPVKTFLISSLLVVGVLSLLAGGFLLTIGNIVRAIRVVGEIANAFAAMSGAMRGANAANGLLSAGILASPWFWLILLIIAVVAAIVILWMKSEKFRNFVKGFWEDLKGWGKAIWGFFVDAWDAVKKFFSQWDEWWGKAKTAVADAWDTIAGFFSDIGSSVAGFFSGIWSSILTGLTDAWGEIAAFFTDLGGWFAKLPGMAREAVGKFVGFIIKQFQRLSWRNVGYAFGYVIGRMIRLPYDLWVAIVGWLAQIIDTFWGWYNDILNVLHDLEWGMIHWAGGTMSAFFSTIWGWIQQIPGIFIEMLTQVLGWLWNAVPNFFQAAWALGQNVWDAIWNFLSGLPGMVAQFLAEAVAYVWNNAGDWFAAAFNLGQQIWDGIIDFVSDIPGEIWRFLTNAVNTVRNMVGSIWDAAYDFGAGALNGFLHGIGARSPSGIEKAFFAIDDQADKTLSHLTRTVRSINRVTPAPYTPSTIGMDSPVTAAAVQNGSWNQNGPLVGTAVIRKDEDITTLARKLERERRTQARARGVTVTPSFAGIGG
jgi:TP901 family phage tail tape measure protein